MDILSAWQSNLHRIVKTWIGRRVQWETARDPHGGYFLRDGILQEVKGRNAMIDGDWKWIPNLHNIKPIEK